MRLPNDPIRFFSWLQRLTLFGGAVVVACITMWALWPLHPPDVAPKEMPSALPAPLQATPEEAFDRKVLAVNLWHMPPQADSVVAAKPPEPPPKPLNVQLIGIINDNGVLHAAIYDIEDDRLLILGNGDHIRGSTIKSITDKAVELTDGRTTRKLVLTVAPNGSGEHS